MGFHFSSRLGTLGLKWSERPFYFCQFCNSKIISLLLDAGVKRRTTLRSEGVEWDKVNVGNILSEKMLLVKH